MDPTIKINHCTTQIETVLSYDHQKFDCAISFNNHIRCLLHISRINLVGSSHYSDLDYSSHNNYLHRNSQIEPDNLHLDNGGLLLPIYFHCSPLMHNSCYFPSRSPDFNC